SPQPRAGSLSLGAAGLVLVLLRLLELAHFRSHAVGDAWWFVSSVGIVASFVGLVVAIVAVVRRFGRMTGGAAIATYLALAGLFFVLHRSPAAIALLSGRPQPGADLVVAP